MHRFFLTPKDQVSNKQVTVLNQNLIHQLTKVLRFQINDQLIFIDESKKQNLICQITSIEKKSLNAEILETNSPDNEPKIKLNLFFPILKNSAKIELILQKGTELGVHQFTPLITQRTEKPVLPKPERLIKIITEAAEQCGRVIIPKLNQPQKFSERLNLPELSLIGNPEATTPIKNIKLPSEVNLFIGPEGGFTPDEIETALKNNFQSFQLGKLILRAETACIVASSQILL